jgi:nucleoside-diphosphate-sugar epimerase
MELVITGAGGFVGGAVVRAALMQGHKVRAILRVGASLGLQHPQLTVHAVGLAHTLELEQALRGADVVVHVAAATRGDYAQQHADTVEATEQLLAAMSAAGIRRLVGLSSFTVYDYAALQDGATLDEGAPLEPEPQRRGVYTQCKLQQEYLFRAFGEQLGHGAVILRPGLVYDESQPWPPALGRALGSRCWLAMGPRDGLLPLVHVEDVASAVLNAVAVTKSDVTILNLIEMPAPKRAPLLQALNDSRQSCLWLVWFPWRLHRALAQGLWRLTGRRKLPGLLDPQELAARFKPLRYDNRAACAALGWQTRHRATLSSSSP